MPSYTKNAPPPPPSSFSLTEAIYDALDHYVTTEVYVVVLVVGLALAIGRYGLYAVVMSPVTFAMWLYNAVRSFRFKPFIVVVGTTEEEFSNRTADTVLSKANAAAKHQSAPPVAAGGPADDSSDAVDQQPAGGPNSAGQRPASGLRNRRQQAPDGSV